MTIGRAQAQQLSLACYLFEERFKGDVYGRASGTGAQAIAEWLQGPRTQSVGGKGTEWAAGLVAQDRLTTA